ncbi:hypothetical protein EDD25_2673 [Cryobacterium psychrophilum]|nr:hypothetical protein EDD25_2673 [Cryobacterium psychrophilum]
MRGRRATGAASRVAQLVCSGAGANHTIGSYFGSHCGPVHPLFVASVNLRHSFFVRIYFYGDCYAQ